MARNDRYHRQRLLRDIGDDGHDRLAASHALIVGCGALGSHAAEMLARAGVGRLTLVDRDVVELTNLQRQVLYTEADAREGKPKAEAARRALHAVNSEIEAVAEVTDFNHSNAEQIAGSGPPPDVIIDGTDNFETRYLLNDLAIKHAIPFIYAGAVETHATMLPVIPGTSPCLRCLVELLPAPGAGPTCDTAGVLGPLVTMIASMQVVEAIKVLTGNLDAVRQSLLSVDPWRNELRSIDAANAKRDDCPCCGTREFAFLDGAAGSQAVSLCGRNAIQIAPGTTSAGFELADLAERLRPHADVTINRFLLRACIGETRGEAGEPMEITVFADGRTIVRGTQREDVARSLCSRYIGM